MKILHLSDVGLPDVRPERVALFSRKKGWEVVFAGGRPAERQIFNVFQKTYYRYWRPYEKTGFPTSLREIRKWVRYLIRKEEPDLIHAHDLFAGKVALDIGHPFVYDDHEIWGSRISYQGSQVIKQRRTLLRRLATWFAIRNWRKWEPPLLRSAPIITVSEEIAELYRQVQPHTYVIPNVPTQQEVEMIPPNKNIDNEFRIAYVSRHDLPLAQRTDEIALRLWLENRFGAKLVYIGPPVIESEEIENHGFVSHQEMFHIMATCDVALVGELLPLPLYSLQNRFSLFLHAGLKTIVPKSMIVEINFCKQYDIGWSWSSADELNTTIRRLVREYFDDVNQWNAGRQRVREVANRHFLWKRYSNQLEQAYAAALERN